MQKEFLSKLESVLSKHRIVVVLYAMLYNHIIWLVSLYYALSFKHHKLLRQYKIHKTIPKSVADNLYNTQMIETYRRYFSDVSDKDGFIMYDKCDSLLFSSLAWASGRNVNIDLAQDLNKPGLWNRRSIKYNQCYPKYSKSTISRDMLIGLMIGAFIRNRFDILLNLHRYGRKNHWLMGYGSISKIHLGSSLEALLGLCLTSYKFKNNFKKLSKLERYLIKVSTYKPITYSKDLLGYQFHLQTLVIFLKMLTTNACQKSDSKALNGGHYWYYGFANVLKSICITSIEDSPKEHEVIGRINYSSKWITENLKKYPKNRLPTSDDVDTTWIWEGHTVNDSDTTYSGCDVLFLYRALAELGR